MLPVTWFWMAAMFGVLGSAITCVSWIAHASAGCNACFRRSLMNPGWNVVRAWVGRALWATALRVVDCAFGGERAKEATA